ncbi:hypothetical protein ACK9YZ_05615 [Rhizobium sp. ZK1]|uniref:hypothetical protein n=1 Tax=Rhizobium sp. ZK1 TaxID=3389872 RepID=UPI0039F743C6
MREAATLLLYQFPETPVDEQPEGLILSPFHRQSQFVGRSDDLASLIEWLADSRSILSRTLFGPPGVGKTRLALQLCSQAGGWRSGFARKEHLRRLVNHPGLDNWSWEYPTLIVVDDASSSGDELARLFESLSDRIDRDDKPPKLRILLLDRTASVDEGWYALVHGYPGDYESRTIQVADPGHPVQLAALDSRSAKAVIDDVLVRRVGNISSAKAILLELETSDDSDSLSGNPLFLQVAAYETEDGGPPALSRMSLLKAVVRRESIKLQKEWKSQGLPDFSFEGLQKLLAIMTIAGRNEPSDLPDILVRFDDLKMLRSTVTLGQIIQAFQRRPRPEIKMEPDLIGDLFSADCEVSPATIAAIYEDDPHRVASRLWRWLGDFGMDRDISARITVWLKEIASMLICTEK